MKEKQLSHTLKYSCFFMDLYEDEIELPDGNPSKRIYIEHPGAAAVLPITTDGNVLLIKQFRYPIRDVTIEVPAGKKDDIEESGLDCVKREIEEETGHQASRYEHFMNMHSCLGYSNELIELFFAFDAMKVDNPLEADDDEFIDVLVVNKQEIVELLQTNQITDGKTIILLQEYLRRYPL